MKWFRFYEGALDDPKVQRLPDSLFKTWVNLLCLTARNGGRLSTIEEIGFALRLCEREAKRRVGALIDAGLIDRDDDGMAPHNWGARQYESDRSAERVKRFRERQKGRDGNGKCNVTSVLPVSPPDTDTDSEANPPPPAQFPSGRADARGGGGENHGLDQIDFRRRCEQAAGGVFAQSAVVARWQADGLNLEGRVLPMIRAIAGDAKKRGSAITSWAYFDGAIRDPARSVSASNVERTCRFVREGDPEFLRLYAAKGPTLVIGRDPSGHRGTWVYDPPGASP